MAKVKYAKLTFKTPLIPIRWVSVRGDGKLKKDKPDDKNPENYNYTATGFLTKAQADKINDTFNKFWRENKPQGVGKQKYDLVKEVMVPTLDVNGKEQRDEDDEIIKHHNGEYTLAAKTLTHWPDGKPNVVKLLGSNGKELQEGHPLEAGCGEGTMGIIHGTIGINDFNDNEGLQFYLNGVQIKESTYTEYTGGNEVDADEIEDDVADTEVADANPEGTGPKV